MCGIIGAVSFGEADSKLEKLRREVSIFMMTELLLLTVERGKDATGLATLFANGDFMGLKMGVPSPEFVARFGETDKDYEGFLKVWRKVTRQCKIVLGHCRKNSIGSSWDNANNHPIKIGDIVGVHNGTLSNHKKIFDKLGCKKDGDVDSEAIFRLLNHYTNDCKDPFTIGMLYEAAIRLDGSYAVLSFNGNNPYQLALMRNSRPMEMVLIRPLKMIFIASEKKFLETAFWRMNKVSTLYNVKKYPLIKKEDLDWQMMLDDHVGLLNLAQEVNNKTIVKDLLEDKRVVSTDKKWKSTSTTYHRNTNFQDKRSTKTEVNASTKKEEGHTGTTGKEGTTQSQGSSTASTDATEKGSKAADGRGMVWNRNFNEYQEESDTSETDKLGNVEIGVEEGAETREVGGEGSVVSSGSGDTEPGVTHDNKNDADDIMLTDADENCEDIITDPAKVNELALQEIQEAETGTTVGDTAKADEEEDTTEDDEDDDVALGPGDIIKVEASDLSFDAEALETANAATDGLERCESEDDVTDQFQLEDNTVLKALPVWALANRIKGFAYKLGFYDGFVKREGKKVDKPIIDERAEEKKKKQEKNIRVLKTMTMMMSRMMSHRKVHGNPYRAIDEEVARSLEKGDELDSGTMKSIFRTGDLMEDAPCKNIQNIIRTVESKENR